MWEEFLAAQGADVPEGERSLATIDLLHEQLLQLARSSGGEYERENVIGDPNQTFGVEIEELALEAVRQFMPSTEDHRYPGKVLTAGLWAAAGLPSE